MFAKLGRQLAHGFGVGRVQTASAFHLHADHLVFAVGHGQGHALLVVVAVVAKAVAASGAGAQAAQLVDHEAFQHLVGAGCPNAVARDAQALHVDAVFVQQIAQQTAFRDVELGGPHHAAVVHQREFGCAAHADGIQVLHQKQVFQRLGVTLGGLAVHVQRHAPLAVVADGPGAVGDGGHQG